MISPGQAGRQFDASEAVAENYGLFIVADEAAGKTGFGRR
jgi:hypothetical protein